MRANAVKQLLRQGKPALGTWLTLGSPLATEWLAHQGFDWLSVEQRHGATDLTLTQSLLQAISTTQVSPFVNVAWKDPQAIGRALDAGAYGVLVPGIETREEAEMIVRSAQYPPLGQRLLGGARRQLYGGADYVQNAKDEILVVAMIQTAGAVRNADSIAAVPGLDACLVEPNDLCASLGLRPSLEPSDERFDDAIKQVFDACRRYHVAPGLHTQSVEYTRYRLSQGWQLIALSSDGTLMAQAARYAVESIQARSGSTDGGADRASEPGSPATACVSEA
jgi:4-hydroxy-2-oxoheptanedioate aldolase